MVARIALQPGEVFIVVSPRGGTQQDSLRFGSLDALREWRVGDGKTVDIHHIQYIAQTQSGREFGMQWSSAPETLNAVQQDPAGYMNLAAQGINVLGGVGGVTMEDDSVQLSVTITDVTDPVEVLVTLLDRYNPEEHGEPLRMEQPGDLIAGPDGEPVISDGRGNAIHSWSAGDVQIHVSVAGEPLRHPFGSIVELEAFAAASTGPITAVHYGLVRKGLRVPTYYAFNRSDDGTLAFHGQQGYGYDGPDDETVEVPADLITAIDSLTFVKGAPIGILIEDASTAYQIKIYGVTDPVAAVKAILATDTLAAIAAAKENGSNEQ